ncbi:MAG TPA: hypothetical protein VGJ16_12655 [Pirellulales bacterium]|jgi:hypothetical protein
MIDVSHDVPTIERARRAIASALEPGHFFASAGHLQIEECLDESWRWEVFRGHLLDPAHTRQTAMFDAWHVIVDAAGQASTPLISVLLDRQGLKLHVVRRILVHAFEAYEDSPGVILSRPVEKWTAELVSTVPLECNADDDLEAELLHAIYSAVVGTSRLPITSLESPLPGFSLGQLAYAPSVHGQRLWNDAATFLEATLHGSGGPAEKSKALEIALRDEHCELERITAALEGWSGQLKTGGGEDPAWVQLFRSLFNGVALSPYTCFADRLVALLVALANRPDAARTTIDLFSYMLRHLCRHLTAFDLVTFHSFGANYPDALFLDALAGGYLTVLNAHPKLIDARDDDSPDMSRAKRLRRRALRQTVILRTQYEGHPVPDAPTSLGENARVLPGPLARVPDEQIANPSTRRRRLFENRAMRELLGAAGETWLAESIRDLADERELVELGRGQFLDRPLGPLKEPGAVDRTPLVSCQAVSKAVIRGRIALLKSAGWLDPSRAEALLEETKQLALRGITLADFSPCERPGVVSLVDLARGPRDWVVERSTPGSLMPVVGAYDLSPLAEISHETAAWLADGRDVILVQHAPPDPPLATATIRIYDRAGALRIELGFEMPPETGVHYRERLGVEMPERLRLLAVHGFDGATVKGVAVQLRKMSQFG